MDVKYLIMQPHYNFNHHSIIEYFICLQFFSIMNDTARNTFVPRDFFFIFRIISFICNLSNLITEQNVYKHFKYSW